MIQANSEGGNMAYALELLNITKAYPGVIANNDVTVKVKTGEIHGLIGENGAGKSTIMNILYGMTEPDEGIVKIFGKEQKISSPMDAIHIGIGMVHQHFMLMPDETVLRNIILGYTPKKGISIDESGAIKEITTIMNAYNLKVDLKAKINQISVGEKQRVEILKALYRKVKILILDEPTAVLTPVETDALLEIMRKLKEQGCTIVFITHKLREVLAVTDKVTVMRKGIVTGKGDTSDMDIAKLSQLIVGREVEFDVAMDDYNPGETVLELSNVCTSLHSGRMPVKNINLNVKRGEIVGIAGVEGNGQSDLVEAIVGIIPLESGSIKLVNKDISKYSIRARRHKGLGHIPEDRMKTGVSASCTISENLMINKYYRKPFSRHGVLNTNIISEFAEKLRVEFLVKSPDTTYALSTLSGGNMQKVVFAREFESLPELLIAAQPTRGVDIGAIEYIHGRIGELRDSGKGILLVSAELDEICALADRIVIIYEGEIVAEFMRGEADEYEIGEYMLGAKKQEVQYEN